MSVVPATTIQPNCIPERSEGSRVPENRHPWSRDASLRSALRWDGALWTAAAKLPQCEAMRKTYWVYFMTNRSGTLYIGLTGNLARRVYEHRHRLIPGFTSRYRIDRLIHVEPYADLRDAIAREKQLKGWRRDRKLAVIAQEKPDWRDLGEEWFGPVEGHHAAVPGAIRGSRGFDPQESMHPDSELPHD